MYQRNNCSNNTKVDEVRLLLHGYIIMEGNLRYECYLELALWFF